MKDARNIREREMRKEKFCKPYFSKRKHNVGCTQKNRLNGIVLLSSEYPSSGTIT